MRWHFSDAAKCNPTVHFCGQIGFTKRLLDWTPFRNSDMWIWAANKSPYYLDVCQKAVVNSAGYFQKGVEREIPTIWIWLAIKAQTAACKWCKSLMPFWETFTIRIWIKNWFALCHLPSLSFYFCFFSLQTLTVGCETVDMTLRRNGLGQLGFHVRLDGTVSEVEEYGFAWQAGLRQGSRLVEICKVAAVTLSHEQMIDLLRTSVTVKVVIIPPFEEGGARRLVSGNLHIFWGFDFIVSAQVVL